MKNGSMLLQKKVFISLKKKSKDSSLECFMGKGIIPKSPAEVFQVLLNPQLRYSYDNMLKSIVPVKRIDELNMVIYMHHETSQCLVKTARDLCVLQSARPAQEQNAPYVLTARSIEFPSVPVKPPIIRAEVQSSGWILEPYLLNSQEYQLALQHDFLLPLSESKTTSQSGTNTSVPYSDSTVAPTSSTFSPPSSTSVPSKLCTRVTYVVQMDPKGPVPASLINMVSRRQPLCIHYLRKHLLKNS